MLKSIPCTLMRGGTSKGLYFHERDLPAERERRDRLLLAAMGSPDVRQIDGVGGAHPLTSKVAIIRKSTVGHADVDYLFLQVVVDKAEVSDSQNCGNILAGVGPWAIEQGLVPIHGDVTPVRIHMLNTASIAVAHVPTPNGAVEYEGEARIDGVPGTAAAIPLEFLDVAGSSCGSLLPTGSAVDEIDGVSVTCIDNGMPVVVLRAGDFGVSGDETPEQLESNATLKSRIEAIRLAVGPRMNLGDVTRKTVPKMCLVSAPRQGGAISTRTFIPHRVHESIGVLGAVSVATACVIPGSVAAEVTKLQGDGAAKRIEVEHPTGFFTVDIEVEIDAGKIDVRRSALLRTARKLMSGEVFVPGALWSGS
ncbi:4-oxalomesaconate tautomerase [Steroidobacter sp. S1-65]|uniref:4-oxalomesaconate tautomerase n=1 Tax=Steroidobacter gossypii TaxID=2805490 RepID=A0ABS1WZ77_9GAMM|nr:4-oxalomesaconate tautomerase [Steroidobacter gossypii]MBM0106283.1 4-oxalomesaconate tautomerase [Steroidobacter gossypii]